MTIQVCLPCRTLIHSASCLVFLSDLAMCLPLPDPDERASSNSPPDVSSAAEGIPDSSALLVPLLPLRYTVSFMIRRSVHRPRSEWRISVGRPLLPIDRLSSSVGTLSLILATYLAPMCSLRFAFRSPPFQIFSDSAPPPHASATRACNHIEVRCTTRNSSDTQSQSWDTATVHPLLNHAIAIKQRSYVHFATSHRPRSSPR